MFNPEDTYQSPWHPSTTMTRFQELSEFIE